VVYAEGEEGDLILVGRSMGLEPLAAWASPRFHLCFNQEIGPL